MRSSHPARPDPDLDTPPIDLHQAWLQGPSGHWGGGGWGSWGRCGRGWESLEPSLPHGWGVTKREAGECANSESE